MQIPRIPALNPAPERQAGVSTPEPGRFRTTLDTARRSPRPGEERGNGALDAQVSNQPSSVDANDRVRERPGAGDAADRTEPRDDLRDDHDVDRVEAGAASRPDDRDSADATSGASELQNDVTDDPSAAESGVESDTLDDPTVGAGPATGVAPVTTSAAGGGSIDTTDSGGGALSSGESRTGNGGGSAEASNATASGVAGDQAAADQPTANRIDERADRVDDARRASVVDQRHSASTGVRGLPGGEGTADAAAGMIAESGSARPGGLQSSGGTAIPEGFTPVAGSIPSSAARPGENVMQAANASTAMATSGAAANLRNLTGDRPGASNGNQPSTDAGRGRASTPAAVARAEEINRTIAAGRSGDGPAANEAVSTEVVTPVKAADLSNRMGRSTAQALPMPSAESAPQTLDEGLTRTTPGVARGLDALARQKGGSLVMRLDPPSLGQLRLEMQMQGGRVAVLMTAASETARSLLHDNLGTLRQALEDRGLAVDRLAVETAGRTSESSSNARSENRGDGQDARGGQDASGRQDAGDERSRGRRDDASRRQAGRGGGPGRPEAVEFGEVLAGAGVSTT